MSRRLTAAILFSTGLLLLPALARSDVIDRIVAVVENEPVLLSELELAKSPFMSKLMAVEDPDRRAEMEQDLTEQVLEQLIGDILLKRQIKALGIVVEDREVQMAVKDVLDRNKVDEEQLKQELEKQGTSFEEYSKQIRDQLSRLKLINMKIKSQVQVSEQDVENYLAQNSPEEDDEIHALHILFALQPEAPDEEVAAVTARAREVLARARRDEDFAELAREFSQGPTAQKGGDLGFFRRGQMVPPFELAAFALEEGQISEPVRTAFGLHLIKVIEKREVKAPEGPEREKVRQGLYQQAMERKLKFWLEELKKTAHIEYKL